MSDNTELLDKIRKLSIIALFTDDDLVNTFVLKGGNAINIVYGSNDRASMDIDVSMSEDFGEDIEVVKEKISNVLSRTFRDEGYEAFDIKLYPTPKRVQEDYEEFWGGYTLEFKIIALEKFEELEGDLPSIQRQATVVGLNQEKKMKVDISKHEYVEGKTAKILGDYTVFVYTPIMVIYEKLRAICQQTEIYTNDWVRSNRRPRARDFFDIHSIMKQFPELDLLDQESLIILKNIFEIKRVPLFLLDRLEQDREFHRQNFESVTQQVNPSTELKDFDFYFDYVKDIAESIYKNMDDLGIDSSS